MTKCSWLIPNHWQTPFSQGLIPYVQTPPRLLCIFDLTYVFICISSPFPVFFLFAVFRGCIFRIDLRHLLSIFGSIIYVYSYFKCIFFRICCFSLFYLALFFLAYLTDFCLRIVFLAFFYTLHSRKPHDILIFFVNLQSQHFATPFSHSLIPFFFSDSLTTFYLLPFSLLHFLLTVTTTHLLFPLLISFFSHSLTTLSSSLFP